jgi:hypothetical protein
MAFFVSREGVWDIVPGGSSETPALKVTGLTAGGLVKVTVNFCAHATNRAANEGFYYSLTSSSSDDVMAVTPATAIFQGDDGWQSCTLITIFEVLSNSKGAAELSCHFNKGDLTGTGTLMNFVLLAEML